MSVNIVKEYLRPIWSLLEDPSIVDIAVNSDRSIWFCSKNAWLRFDGTLHPKSVRAISSILTSQKRQTHKHINCFDLENLRIAIARPPISNTNEVMVIRKHKKASYATEDFTLSSSIEPISCSNFNRNSSGFEKIISDRKNIIISGETGSGKTSFLCSLTKFFHPYERIVFIQDTVEITSEVSNSISLITNDEITLNSLISFSLRCCPNRIIVGEIRGEEVYAFLDSCNTGHKGNITTVHANSARDTIYRLETLLYGAREANNWSSSMIKRMICSNIDYIVHMKRGTSTPIINEIISIEKENNKYQITSINAYGKCNQLLEI
ncbi:ATPase, T2SS/T4P/T4SS family [Candidatus Ichthyocystis hellenicum]|uniref:ATPase, T2SS/T4P/T4SS family n=1 Tax=Candidatus Ichthyocystis hellenicum TaxID=1561003 RepID=UPI0015846EA6|nr:ATPase, T2SS/T4P/T4SS family [Candidatus Ichthyocystis hellenicum]